MTARELLRVGLTLVAAVVIAIELWAFMAVIAVSVQ